MLGGGYYWQKRYPVLAQALSGGGIAILYLSTFAAFVIYELIAVYSAFGFLFLISIASAGLAIWYNSKALAIIGILGAFMAPFALGAFGTRGTAAGGGVPVAQLLTYFMVIDFGVLALSTLRNWRWFTLLALLGSLASFGILYDQFGDTARLLTFQLSLTIIFLVFVAATTLFHVIWHRAPQGFDQLLMVLNAAAYYSISLGLLWDDFRPWLGGFTLLLAIFYGGLAYITLRRSADNARLSLFALAIALLLVTVAIPVQLGNRAWTTVAWASEGAILMWLSFTLRMHQLRYYSYAVFTIMSIRLLFFDTQVNIGSFQPIFNARFLAFLVSIAALYFSGRLLLDEWKSSRQGRLVVTLFFVAANFFSLWLLSVEVLNIFDNQIAALTSQEAMAHRASLRSAQSLSLTAVWTIYAVILLVVGITRRWRPVRIGALALIVVAIGKVFVYDVFTLGLVYRIIAFVGLGLLLLISAYLYQRYSKGIRGFLVEK